MRTVLSVLACTFAVAIVSVTPAMAAPCSCVQLCCPNRATCETVCCTEWGWTTCGEWGMCLGGDPHNMATTVLSEESFLDSLSQPAEEESPSSPVIPGLD